MNNDYPTPEEQRAEFLKEVTSFDLEQEMISAPLNNEGSRF